MNWYDHDIFVVRAANLSPSDADVLNRTVETIRRQLEDDAGLGPVRIAHAPTGLQGQPGNAPLADKAAIMLVFVTPEFCRPGPWQEEVRRFCDDISNKTRTPDQLVIYELRTIEPAQWSAMPWTAIVRQEMIHSLFNRSTKMPFSDAERLRRHVWLTSNDIAERLRNLRASQDAAAKVQAPAPVPKTITQVYLMEHNGRPDLWSETRRVLTAPPGLTVYPAEMRRAANREERRELRENRRNILDICDALLLLRGDASDSIDLLSADAIADLNDVGRKLALCIDWAGQPAPLWPDSFHPETIVAAPGDDWAAAVKSRLAGGTERP